ncbi:unnamed protein product, partial [Laminaria digitata]
LVRPADSTGPAPEDRRRVLEFALDSVLALPEPPSVICAGNDRLAMQIYGILRTRGIRVPEDISIAGYDDYRLISETLYPPLTTVELPYHQIGMKAADLLLNRLANKASGRSEVYRVGGGVKWRDSVIKPRRSLN